MIWNEILTNLTYTGIGMALFVICYVSNMSFSLYYNIKVLHEPFDKKKLLDSLYKVIAFGIGTVLLCVGITSVVLFCDYVGLTIPEQYQEVFQNLAIITVFVIASCRYIFEAFTKFKAILNDEKQPEESSEDINE